MKNKSAWKWAADMFLVGAFTDLQSGKGQQQTRRGLVLAAVQGVIEGVGLFAIIPTVVTFTTHDQFLGLGWVGWVIVLAALAVVGGVVNYLHSMTTYLGAMDLMSATSLAVGDKVARLPLGWFTAKTSGMLSRLTGGSTMEIGNAVAHILGVVMRGLATTLTMMVLAWFWSWQLGLTLLLAVPVVLLLGVLTRWLNLRGHEAMAPTERELASRIVEYAQAQPALRACGAAKGYQPLEHAQCESVRTRKRSMWLGVAANAIGGMGAQTVLVILVTITTALGLAGKLEPVAVIAFIGVFLRFMHVLGDLSSHLLAIETARTPLLEIRDLLLAEELPTVNQPVELTRPGELEFRDVTFSYDGEHRVLDGLSCSMPAHSFTAIVGPSGSGKTTMFRLAARFWDVDSGAVLVGGRNVREQPTEQLMSQLSMVFQDVYLYDTSLLENIRVGRTDATDEEAMAAGALAGVDEIVRRLPGGWQASVGEGGKRLSGGERQRVSVARALLKGAPIVLFDEATSALDPENEAQIEAAIEELRRTSTVVVIAHKLNTIQSADQILVLDHHGKLVQTGTHDELISQGGLYEQLWNARRDAHGWSLTEIR